MKRAVLLPIASSKTDKASLLSYAKRWHAVNGIVPCVQAEAMTWYWLLKWAGAPR